MKQTILSGVQATGKLHIGNYLGAIKEFVELGNNPDYDTFFFIADLHALTVPRDPEQLRQDTLEVIAEYIAIGLDPEKSTLFIQNHVQEQIELAWIFSCITPIAELERMTQYKEKSYTTKKSPNAGLLTYPTLMASDILMYKPDLVPVGEDQQQHLELARIIARKFNNRFGETFPEPKAFVQKPLRIMSLKNPAKKMSKTGDNPIYMSDEPEVIMTKVKKAVTATSDEGSPGVDNLLFLLEQFGASKQAETFKAAIADRSIQYSNLKTELATVIADHFADFRAKKKQLMDNPEELHKILAAGAAKAQTKAQETMKEVKQKVGLL